MTDVDELLLGRTLILLDFDGPICNAFGAIGAQRVAAELRTYATACGYGGPDVTPDPLALLRQIASDRPDLVPDVDRELRRLELIAIKEAPPTPGADEFLRIAAKLRVLVAVVSNNSAEAIAHYLAAHHLDSFVATIQGRPIAPMDMKPNPRTLQLALAETAQSHDRTIMVGDSDTDVAAAHTIELPCIGLANKPGKKELLVASGADAIVQTMTELGAHLAATLSE